MCCKPVLVGSSIRSGRHGALKEKCCTDTVTVIRACIAMAYPPLPPDRVPCLEVVGVGSPSRLVHGDMHDNNGRSARSYDVPR